MIKLHLPATVYSTYDKVKKTVKVKIDDNSMNDKDWDIIEEIAEANSMSVDELSTKLEDYPPSVFDDAVEFYSDVINLNDVNTIM